MAIFEGDIFLGSFSQISSSSASGNTFCEDNASSISSSHAAQVSNLRAEGNILLENSVNCSTVEVAFGCSLWPRDGSGKVRIPFIVEGNWGAETENMKSEISRAMDHIKDKVPSVLFVEENGEDNYISFITGEGCASWVGMIGGKQSIELSLGCDFGRIVHEIGHALGLFHEQNRDMRNSFVEIICENIVDGKKHNFAFTEDCIEEATQYSRNDSIYDYGSIMHYHPRDFGKPNPFPFSIFNDRKKVIRILGDARGIEIGQRKALSSGDIHALMTLYPVSTNSLPTATILTPTDISQFLVGDTIGFTGSGSDPEDGVLTGSSLVWNSNKDGQIGTGTSFARTLSQGTHTITLTATDSGNATGTDVHTIVVNAPSNSSPSATISSPAHLSQFTTSQTISFSGTGSDSEDGPLTGSSLVWASAIDGQLGTGTGFSRTLSQGTHTITLTATDSGNATGTDVHTIVVNAPTNSSPSATINSPAHLSQFTTSQTISFSGTGSDSEDGPLTGSSLVWASTIDGQLGTGTSFSQTLSQGTHTITLTATDSGNATGTDIHTIVVNAPTNSSPSATIKSPAHLSQFTTSQTISFSGSASDPEDGALTGNSLVWTSNISGIISTGTSFSTNLSQGGTHTITLTATDSGGLTATDVHTIIVTGGSNSTPSATIISPGNNSQFTTSQLISFSGSGSDTEDGNLTGGSLVWTSNLSGQIGTGTGFSRTLSQGTHTITLTATDSGGQSATAVRTVIVNAPVPNTPSATMNTPTNSSSFLLTQTISFSGSGSDPQDGVLTGGSLVWTSSRDGQIGTGTSFSKVLSQGTHTITLTVTDSGGLTDSTSRSITVSKVYDDFSSSGSPNSSRWTIIEQGLNSSIAASSGKLRITFPTNLGTPFVTNLRSDCYLTGNFDIQVDFQLVSWESGFDYSGVRVGFGLRRVGSQTSNGRVSVERTSFGPNDSSGHFNQETFVASENIASPGIFGGPVQTSTLSGGFRLTRSSSTITAYYKSGSGAWTSLGTRSAHQTCIFDCLWERMDLILMG